MTKNATVTIEIEILLKDLVAEEMGVLIFEKIAEWMHENLQGEEDVDYWHDAIYDANFKDLKLKAEYPGCVYFDVTFPYEYKIKNNKVELSGANGL